MSLADKSPIEILQTYWKLSSFRPNQEEIISSILDKRDTLALLPTGGGKSLCFQIPAMIIPGVCLVITPLIALMKDQISALNKRGIPATAIFSGMNKREIEYQLDKCIHEKIKFLYLSPERTESAIFLARLPDMKISFIAVDEAHCISQWGYDFRPSYLKIHLLRDLLKNTPILALTASATPEIVIDIQKSLEFKEQHVIRSSFKRDNLSYNFIFEENKLQKILDIIKKIKGSGLIYVRSRAKTQEISNYLTSFNLPSDFYHAGLNSEIREKKQLNWLNGTNAIMVCTNAFGMGIDKPDVNFVIHLDIPDAIESYFQEAGRAGRNGNRAYAILLYNQLDIDKLKERKNAFPSITLLKKLYQELYTFYNISYQSGLNTTFPFDLKTFNEKKEWNYQTLLKGLQLLEQNELILLNEAFYKPSKLYIQATKKELYKFQIENQKLDVLIKVILRMYGGVFETYVKIDEHKIAIALKSNTAEIIKALKYIADQNLIDYIPQDDNATITFLDNRYDNNQLELNHQLINQRLNYYNLQIEEIEKLVLDNEKCRSISLLAYFGEDNNIPCGICDFCRSIHQKESKIDIALYNQVIQILKPNPISLDVLLSKFNDNKHIEVHNIVSLLIEKEFLKRNEGNVLILDSNHSL